MQLKFSARILDKYDVSYFHCSQCGFLNTETPYWLDEAYSDAIAVTDTGVMERNVSLSARLAVLLNFCLEPEGRYLDAAGGYGLLTRLMRDNGFDYYWADKYCTNLVARGFEYKESGLPLVAVSGFEVIEHVPDPRAFISDLLLAYKSRTFIFSTELYSGNQPPAPDWWFYSRITGQHISFFQRRTLERLAGKLGLTLYAGGGIFVMTDRPLRNTWILGMLGSRLAYPLSRMVRRQLGSRTMTDHNHMTEELQRRSEDCR